MKTRFAIWLGIGMTLLAAPGILRAGLVNGSFESWDILGWTVQNDVGLRATEPFSRPAGVARTVSSWGEAWGFDPALTAADGYRFLSLNTRVNANFIGNETYNLIVSQSFSLNLADTVSGRSFFFNGDSEPLDSAWVRILDNDQNLVATLWSETSGSPETTLTPASSAPGWTPWQWTALAAGNYTLQLGMTTSGADNSASFGCFDGILVTAQPIPEPSTLVLGLVGGLMLVGLRNRNR